MCECCAAETCSYDIGLPGWWLVRATKDGREMSPGDWGLVESNSPTYIWSVTPEINRFDFDSDGEAIDVTEETWAVASAYSAKVKKFAEGLIGFPRAGYALMKACMEVGYNQDRDGDFHYWLFNYLAHKIQNQIPAYYDDPFFETPYSQQLAIILK